jgi:hypothetical protein
MRLSRAAGDVDLHRLLDDIGSLIMNAQAQRRALAGLPMPAIQTNKRPARQQPIVRARQ